jgi:flagellar biosynthetic protein FliP
MTPASGSVRARPSGRAWRRPAVFVCATAVLMLLAGATLSAQPPQRLDLRVDGVGSVSAPLQVVLLLTLLSFLPAILVTMTCFTRIVIVFHFLRQALGTQEMPSNQILIGLSLFLTMFIMAPTGDKLYTAAVEPAMAGKLDLAAAMSASAPPLREFMLKQTREKDLALFVELGKVARPETPDDLPMRVVIPAYIISELKTGFQMGFFLFIPFMLIDLIVSTTLLSMGMMQLPPAMISLPFKLLLFVMIDGWNLLVGSIVRSFL